MTGCWHRRSASYDTDELSNVIFYTLVLLGTLIGNFGLISENVLARDYSGVASPLLGIVEVHPLRILLT